ncbi:lipopolysaccharide biosynthesis protein [Blastococcus sp. KM273129]|uniref:lipopolysaccharide biosynthesis protein n=1 Tax=Blastococcus sp. KM273129 TaxID=2570315 RepID=UPI001F24BEF1|nr:lipopolysaccharide biosynthesis protein [Blastococcus sp. KM273129]MCF6736926.1 lipopolysaccharide biosynthesis protein [Blastococcus sp. KM273129]
MGLVRTAIRGLSWSMLAAVGQAVLQLVAIVVLSRLVTVEEFGIAAASMVVLSLVVMVSQLGVGPALVQARRLDGADVATAFYLSTALSIVLAAGLFLLAPLVGPLVGLPPDGSYLRLVSMALVLGALSAVATGLLQRRLRFRALALLQLFSYGFGYLGTAVVLAYAGAGAAALIWGQIAQSLLLAIGGYALERHDVRPHRPAAMLASGKKVFRFGSGYSLSQLGNWVGTNGDNLVVTSMLGPVALGLYSRAYQLLVTPAQLIGTVADKVLFPAMSRVQHEPDRLARAYVVANSLVAVVTLPASVLLCVLAPEIVRILLGPGWSGVTLPLQILAVVLLPRTAYKISGSLTRATGAVFGGAWRQWLYAVEVVAACWIGSHWGVVGVAAGASGAIVAHWATMLKFSGRVRPGLVHSVLRAYARSLPTTAVTAAVAVPVAVWLRSYSSEVLTLLGTGSIAVAAGGLTLLLTRRLFQEEFRLLRSGRRPRRAAPAPVPPTPEPADL